MAMFYLLDGMLIVIRSDRNVSYKSINIKRHFSIAQLDLLTTVNNFKARLKGVDCKGYVISPIKRKTTRACANTSRAEASSRTIRCPCVLQAT